MSSAWPQISRKFLNFSSSPSNTASRRRKQGPIYGKRRSSLAFTLRLLCTICPSKRFHRKCHCLRPYRWHQRKAQEVKWFKEGRWKCQSRVEKGSQGSLLPGAPPAHSQAWLSATRGPGCPHRHLSACKSPSAVRLAAHVFLTTSTEPWVEGAILQNQLKANGRANTQKSQSGGYEPLRR